MLKIKIYEPVMTWERNVKQQAEIAAVVKAISVTTTNSLIL